MKKVVSIILPLLILFFVFDILSKTILSKTTAAAVDYKVGSYSYTVHKIEQKLKDLRFFKGKPDNKYDYQTRYAVIKFQKVKGIKPDGIAGSKTLKLLGIYSGNTSGTKKASSRPASAEAGLLARAINGESRGEPYIGQVAVGAVIVNRTRDPRFPRTISGVVYQPGAFTAVTDGQINANIESSTLKAAQDAINGWDPTGGCVFYYNPAKTTNKWIWSRPILKKIGKHYFCK